MIISHKHKYVFIRARKTGGTSTEAMLAKHCGAKDVVTYEKSREYLHQARNNVENYPPHAPASRIAKDLPEIWEAYFTFAFVRNPFDRAVSVYWYHRNEFKKAYFKRKGPFEINEYLQSLDAWYLTNWHNYRDGRGNVLLDFVGRFESLQIDFEKVCSIIGLPKIILPFYRSYTRQSTEHYRQLLNPKTRAHIEKICAGELEHFGYAW